MKHFLEAQITLDPKFISRAVVTVVNAMNLADELLKYPKLFECFNNAACAMLLLDTLDPSDATLAPLQRALCAAKEARWFLTDLHRFIAAMKQTRADLEEIGQVTSTLQVVYPRFADPTASTDHTPARSSASDAGNANGKGVGDDIPF